MTTAKVLKDRRFTTRTGSYADQSPHLMTLLSCAPGVIVRNRRFSRLHTLTLPLSPPTASNGSSDVAVLNAQHRTGKLVPSCPKSVSF